MTIRPAHLDELSRALADTGQRHAKIASVDLSALASILEHIPEDMTATVQAGVTLRSLQERLSGSGQWLPIDPLFPEPLSIGDLLAVNRSGPRRLGYGTIRDYVIGMRVALADGRIIKSGGKVVKNVAGYDLAKLFIGSRGTLGVIVEATFKLRPLPEAEEFVETTFSSLEEADAFLDSVASSDLAPVVLDLHNLAAGTPSAGPLTAVLGFAGARVDVQGELARVRELGADRPSNLMHERTFWTSAPAAECKSVSVLSSALIPTLRELRPSGFVARAGNGVIHYRGGKDLPKSSPPLHLTRRVKDAFDPGHVFPEYPA